MATTHTIPPTPFPRLGEIYRNLALSLGTKQDSNELDRLAREGEYDWRIPDALMDKLFIEPINELTQRTEQKNKKTLANRFSALTLEFLTAVQEAYLQLVTSMELTATDRNSALPLLIEAFFGPAAGFGLKKFKEKLGGPDLDKLLDASTTPIEEAFLWFENTAKINIKELFPESHGSDRYQMELIRRWRADDSLPDYNSINKSIDEIFKRSQGQANKRLEVLCNKLAFWLLVGRSISWFCKNTKNKPKTAIKNHLYNPETEQAAIHHLIKLNTENEQETAIKSAKHYLKLKEGLYKKTPQPRDKEELLSILNEFEKILETNEKHRGYLFHATQFRARWHALNGEMSVALPLYEKALKEASYRGGKIQKNIVRETLTVAAYLCKFKDSFSTNEKRINPRSVIKRVKHQAIAVGLIPHPVTRDIVEDFDIEQILQGFYAVFPENMFFKDSFPIKKSPQHLPFLIGVIDESEKPDLSNPNKIKTIQFHGDQSRRMSQLHYFVWEGNTDAVRELLKHGASPDILDQSGGSCILHAIQNPDQPGQREILELLLRHPHKKETINRVTPRKRLNVLHLALELGDPSVISRLLSMGADPKIQADTSNVHALYRWAELVLTLINPQRILDKFISEIHGGKDLYKETLRRWTPPFTDLFGETIINQIIKTHPEIFLVAAERVLKSTTKNLSLPKLLEIGELLLKAGANPNEQEFPPGIPKASNPGRTPLMLLAQGGNAEAFDLLVRHGGDPEKRDAMGKNCLEIAIGFGNKAVVDYLTGKQAV